MLYRLPLVLLCIALISVLPNHAQTGVIARLPRTTRADAVARAKKLANHAWVCGASNVHASCSTRYVSDWKPGQRVTGIPYRWGGIDTPEEFDRKLANGLAAGAHSRYGVLSCAAGMDCSGFIYYVLTQAGLKDVPRDASGQYSWVRKANNFRAVISKNLDGFELDELKPGDLLFWSGTYKTDRDPPVTHTMIYLGREKDTGNRVMVGSSDGRSYHGNQRPGPLQQRDLAQRHLAAADDEHSLPGEIEKYRKIVH